MASMRELQKLVRNYCSKPISEREGSQEVATIRQLTGYALSGVATNRDLSDDKNQDVIHEGRQSKSTVLLPSSHRLLMEKLGPVMAEMERRKVEDKEKWEHVQYGQTQWHIRLSQRAGTCTPETSDPVHVILFRIQFLQQNPSLLSSLVYDSHKRNGECIATWCKTGQYKSAAGSAKMGEAGMHVGTFTLAGGIAAQLAASAVDQRFPFFKPR